MTSWAISDQDDLDIEGARKQLERVRAKVREVIKIMTIEQALLAQRLVRESGRRRGP